MVAIVACSVGPEKAHEEEFGWIGIATIDTEGTITIQLRSQEEDGTIAHGYFSYPKDHEDYQDIKQHVGKLEVGEEKPIPPWKN